MKQFLASKLIGKKVLLLGYGKEGASTYTLLRNYFPDMPLTVADKNTALEDFFKELNDPCLTVVTGDNYLEVALLFDVIIKSPGVSLKDFPLIYTSGKVTSQTDLFLQHYSIQTIGVTGTKGKSTVSSLIHHILSQSNIHSILCGNIGVPVFDSIPFITPSIFIVVELSSHQLEFLTVSPRISVLLNLFQEHLDHYTSLEAYHVSKTNIFTKQDHSDFFIFHGEDENIQQFLKTLSVKSKLYPFVLNTEAIQLLEASNLKGNHNALNIQAVSIAAKLVGVSNVSIKQALHTFNALPHRMEFVGEYKGIRFYNDSISTIPEAAIQSVLALKDVDTLILGGFDRGIDYTSLIEFVGDTQISTLVFLGKAGERMLQGIKERNVFKGNLQMVTKLSEAIEIAFEKTKPGSICLLSPAAASYDQFKNFEERGDDYKKQIRSTI